MSDPRKWTDYTSTAPEDWRDEVRRVVREETQGIRFALGIVLAQLTLIFAIVVLS